MPTGAFEQGGGAGGGAPGVEVLVSIERRRRCGQRIRSGDPEVLEQPPEPYPSRLVHPQTPADDVGMKFFEEARVLALDLLERHLPEALVLALHAAQRFGRALAMIEERVVEIEQNGADPPAAATVCAWDACPPSGC